MITGRVANREAIVELEVLGPSQALRRIETVIDTGYNGHITLPPSLISALGLPFAGHRRGRLADGSVTVLDIYLATLIWHGPTREVLVSQAAGTPLLGMGLLQGCRLTVDAFENGDVTIRELPQRP